MKPATNETIFFLKLYKYEGVWCFDFPELELETEPFVDGMDTMIDLMVEYFKPRTETPTLAFSCEGRIGPNVQFFHHRTEWRGGEPWHLYHCDALDHEGWLCPALLKFYQEPPFVVHANLANRPLTLPALRIC